MTDESPQASQQELLDYLKAVHGNYVFALQQYDDLEPREVYQMKGKIRALESVMEYVESPTPTDVPEPRNELYRELSDACRGLLDEHNDSVERPPNTDQEVY